MYRPLKMFAEQTDELKKLITDHPDYPIVFLCDSEVIADDDYNSWYAPCLSFYIGELLDCEQTIDDTKVYTDRDDFEEDIVNILCDDDRYTNASDEEFDKAVAEVMKEYEQYWKPVIVVHGSV